jgi:hypothetical protein
MDLSPDSLNVLSMNLFYNNFNLELNVNNTRGAR